jgi:hypothetical protein
MATASEKRDMVPKDEATTPESAELALVPRFDSAAMDAAIENFRLLSDVLRRNMRRGYHFGKFPGWQKDQLLEPGASLILNGFKLYADPVRIDRKEDDDGHVRYGVVVHLRPIGRPEMVVAAGAGSSSTREVKYAYRWVRENEVPRGLDKTDLRTKEVRDGTLFRVPNEDPGDLDNTVLKMAVKRAEVDAVNHLPGVSELFPPGTAEPPAEPARPAPVTVEARPAPAAGPALEDVKRQIRDLMDDPYVRDSRELRHRTDELLNQRLDARKLASVSMAKPEDRDFLVTLLEDLKRIVGA